MMRSRPSPFSMGNENAVGKGNKSMGMSAKELVDYDADIILVAPCGMDRKRAKSDGEQMWRHDWWRELRAVKDGKVGGSRPQ